MGGFFSKTFRRNPEGYQEISNNSSKPVIPTIFYQVAIKKGSIQNENNKNEKILKCLQVSDFLSRPKNYKVGIQNGGGFFNFAKSKKKPLIKIIKTKTGILLPTNSKNYLMIRQIFH